NMIAKILRWFISLLSRVWVKIILRCDALVPAVFQRKSRRNMIAKIQTWLISPFFWALVKIPAIYDALVPAVFQSESRCKNKTTPLDEVKRKLENQKYQLTAKLEKVEIERQKNKEDLQYVEKEITQRESLDSKNMLLAEKEKLLRHQWKLDEIKTNYKRQLLNIENALEPLEIYKQD
ncbi:hypothetical protein AMECASPLE_028928, partial [Ameca splendens]